MAKPRDKLPSRSVEIRCAACRTFLYRYAKGGKGALVKCFKQRILEDATEATATCPGCGQVFGREAQIRGVPAIKIIGPKVRVK